MRLAILTGQLREMAQIDSGALLRPIRVENYMVLREAQAAMENEDRRRAQPSLRIP